MYIKKFSSTDQFTLVNKRCVYIIFVQVRVLPDHAVRRTKNFKHALLYYIIYNAINYFNENRMYVCMYIIY